MQYSLPQQSQPSYASQYQENVHEQSVRQGSSFEQPAWLLDLQPNIQQHDVEIINYFLNKFMAHVAPALPIFEDFEKFPDELQSCSLILAMAAVGGLYCPIEGGFRISLSMQTDARRLAISQVSLLASICRNCKWSIISKQKFRHCQRINPRQRKEQVLPSRSVQQPMAACN